MERDGDCQLSPFPSTHWSLIDRLRREGGDVPDGALSSFLVRYLPALRAHLLRTRRLQSHDAEDLVQAFCLEKVVRGRLVRYVDRSRGRFRTYLLKVLDRYVITQHRRATTTRTAPAAGVISMDAIDPVGASRDFTLAFDIAWARQVIAQAIERVKKVCDASGRPDLWGVLTQRVIDPIFTNGSPTSYAELVAQFDFESPAQAANALVTAKRMFRKALHDVIGEYARDEHEIAEELLDLKRILASAPDVNEQGL